MDHIKFARYLQTVPRYIPIFISCVCLLALSILLLQEILSINNGVFAYTLDDPYIHLAMAENILHGHYGVNLNEYSSPSSSIIWPLLLSPFTVLDFAHFVPFIINLIVSFLILLLVSSMIQRHWTIPDDWKKHYLTLPFMVLYIAGTNLLVLVFNGMEHSLQILSGLIILDQLIRFSQTKTISIWLVISVIAAPLVRYENLSISLTAIILILLNGNKTHAFLLGIATLAPILTFSIFLNRIGLDILPSSVLTKSVNSNNSIHEWLLGNLIRTLLVPSGHFLVLAFIFFCVTALLLKNKNQRNLVLCFCLPALLHILAGKYDWFLRYEMYVISWILLTIPYSLQLLARQSGAKRSMLPIVGIFGFLWLIVGFQILTKHVEATKRIPLYSSYTVSQPFHMHRIAMHFNGPVGVNDLGYVSFHNDNYVLDFWGLASDEARKNRLEHGDNTGWMKTLAEKHGVHLVMITEKWFPALPSGWQKLAYLCLANPTSTANSCIAIIATEEKYVHPVYTAVRHAEQDLPANAQLVWNTVIFEKP